ncbi:class I SAM-dependent methyltransferase [Dankookia rubra]|nr:class I SAM-dependent methyltransferase [Dankookia rubra]
MAFDARAFTAFERAAHDRIAVPYAEHFAPLTSLALGPLLDTARVAAGMRALDVATGPGVAAAAARARGAAVTGVDVSPGMIALARKAHPAIVFQEADIVALPFPDGIFDAVVGNFALGHFPEPEAALAECMRVLAPGSALAFSWWDQPARQRVQGLFRETIAELGLPPHPDVPQGHDTLRFSNPKAFAELLRGAGLSGVAVTEHRTVQAMPDIEALWRAGMGGMAVTASAIAVQNAATQARAREVLARRAEAHRGPMGFEIPIAYFIGSGQRP